MKLQTGFRWIFESGIISYTVGYCGNETRPQETCQIMMLSAKQNMQIDALILVFEYTCTFRWNIPKILKNSGI